jgi:alanine dehydrogenase
MRTHLVGILLVVAMAPAVARAEHPNLDLHVGVGAPAGGIGLGVRMGRVEVLAEGELVGAAFVMAMSASAHVNVDVVSHPRWSLYSGAFAAVLQVVMGSDEVIEEQYRGGGPVIGVRIHHRSGSMSHSIELGAMYGRCAQQMCNDGADWVSLQAAYRLHFHLF